MLSHQAGSGNGKHPDSSRVKATGKELLTGVEGYTTGALFGRTEVIQLKASLYSSVDKSSILLGKLLTVTNSQ